MIEMLLAAPASGSGKTAVTCGLLALLKRMGKNPCAFKCGPDYIDPMFHRSVLGVKSHNLDLFLNPAENLVREYDYYKEGHDAAVCEGVMGFYDGVGGTTDQASAWHTASVLHLPVLLVIRPKGASLTLAAQIRGLKEFRTPSRIAGVILNDCSPMLFKSLEKTLEKESGVPILGYLPHMPQAEFESRHLGLYTASEIADLSERVEQIADQMEKSLDIARMMRLFEKPDLIRHHRRPECPKTGKVLEEYIKQNPYPEVIKHQPVRIAVSRDEAFCFVYEESLDLFRQMGAQVEFFSPCHDLEIPEDCQGLYLTGGYPELHAEVLSENESMRQSVADAVRKNMPVIAECGGFLYLGKSLEGEDGIRYPMAGVLPGDAVRKDRLVRFGYSVLTAGTDSMLFRRGEQIPVHEFHYWDSTENGCDLHAEKPVSGRSWDFGFASDCMYAGFPHLYFAGYPRLAKRFLTACRRWRERKE